MGFGISYEMVITLFVALTGLLFIVLGYTFLAGPFIQLTFLFGLFITVIGWAKKDYDQFYTGVLLMIVALVFISALPGVGLRQGDLEKSLTDAINPILNLVHVMYSVHPIFFVLLVILVAYAISRK